MTDTNRLPPGIKKLPGSKRFPKGGWQVRYRDDKNATTRRTFALKTDALDFHAATRTDIRRGDYVPPKLALTPFANVAEGWYQAFELQVEKGYRKPKTLAGYRQILNSHVLRAFEHKAIGQIGTDDIETFLAELDVEPGTQRNVLNVLNPIFQKAIKAGLVKVNPCSLVELPPVNRREMKFLSQEQVGQLAEAIAPEYRTLILTTAYTGMRYGEVAALRRKNVDLMKRRISVKESVVFISGHPHFGKPKTAKGIRTIGIPRFLIDALTEQTAGKAPEDLVFTGPHGGVLRHTSFYQRHFRPAVKKLVADGVWPADLVALRFHDLRHTAATFMIRTNPNLKVISDSLGHKSVATTLDLYGHVDETDREAAAEALNAGYETQKAAAANADVVPMKKRKAR